MTGVADKFKTEGGGNFIKGVDFDDGLALVAVGMEKFKPGNAKYSVDEKSWFVKEGILEVGESFKYTFKVDDVVKEYDNDSCGFYFAFTNLNPAEGAEIWIKRDMKSQTEVEWIVELYTDQQGATSEVDGEVE